MSVMTEEAIKVLHELLQESTRKLNHYMMECHRIERAIVCIKEAEEEIQNERFNRPTDEKDAGSMPECGIPDRGIRGLFRNQKSQDRQTDLKARGAEGDDPGSPGHAKPSDRIHKEKA